jgi:hypothetical protein
MDVPLVVLLIFPQCHHRKLLRMVIDALVAFRAEEHEVFCPMNVFGPSLAPPARTILLEGNDVRHLRKIAGGKCDVMFEKILVTPVEFAAPACRNEKDETGEGRHPTCGPYRE